MDLNDMIDAFRDREDEVLDRLKMRLDDQFVQLAAVIAGADRAIADTENDPAGARDALEAVRNQIEEMFKRSGVDLVGSPGLPIDPDCHEVTEARGEPIPGPATIIEVINYGVRDTQTGRLLARARVAATIASNKPEA